MGTYGVAACNYEWLWSFVCCLIAFFDWNWLFLYFCRYQKSPALLCSLITSFIAFFIDTWTYGYTSIWFILTRMFIDSPLLFTNLSPFLCCHIRILLFLFLLLLFLFQISIFLFGNNWQCLLLFFSIFFLAFPQFVVPWLFVTNASIPAPTSASVV